MTAFKDKYVNYNGVDITTTGYYMSPLVNSGSGTRNSPMRSRGNQTGRTNTHFILANGINRWTNRTSYEDNNTFTGTSPYDTILDYTRHQTDLSTGTQYNYIFNCNVVKFLQNNYATVTNRGSNSYFFKSCIIQNMFTGTLSGVEYDSVIRHERCLIYNINNRSNLIYNISPNNSFVGIVTKLLENRSINALTTGYNYSTFEKCQVDISASLSTNTFKAYDSCLFKIGAETEYTLLTGNTPDELKANFISRCTAQGLTVTCPNWLFTSGQILDGVTWKDSDIYNFEVAKGVVGQMGWRSERGIKIPITTDNKANSISPANPNTNLVIDKDSITLNPALSLNERNKGYATSNIIWLGAKVNINNIVVSRIINQAIGANMDSLANTMIDQEPIDTDAILESGKYYWLTSSDGAVATITFNGVTYSSAQGSLNWLILGNGSSSYVPVSGSPVVYEVLDNLSYQSIGMRVIHSVTDKQLKTGQLDLGRWYMVEHDNDQSNTTDYIRVAGKNYYVGSSFWVEFSNMQNGWQIVGNVHLLPLWRETEDNWMNVLPDDTRCILARGNKGQLEVARDSEGKYLSSGHPDFYNQVTDPDNQVGYLTGTYIQLRLAMNTKNIEYNSHPNPIDTYVNYIRGVIINAVKSTDKSRNWGQFI